MFVSIKNEWTRNVWICQSKFIKKYRSTLTHLEHKTLVGNIL